MLQLCHESHGREGRRTGRGGCGGMVLPSMLPSAELGVAQHVVPAHRWWSCQGCPELRCIAGRDCMRAVPDINGSSVCRTVLKSSSLSQSASLNESRHKHQIQNSHEHGTSSTTVTHKHPDTPPVADAVTGTTQTQALKREHDAYSFSSTPSYSSSSKPHSSKSALKSSLVTSSWASRARGGASPWHRRRR